MRPHQIILLAFFVFAFIFSCKTEEDNFDRGFGHEYMGLEVGKYIVYQVDSIIFDPTGDSLISYTHSFIKDEIVDTLHDNIGELLYKTERFVRKDSNAPWQVQKVYSQSIQGENRTMGIVTEDNLRYVKLVFPIEASNYWNPIAFIDPKTQITVAGETLEPFLQNDIWRSSILAVDEPDTVGTFQFDEVLRLREVETSGKSSLDFNAGESPFEFKSKIPLNSFETKPSSFELRRSYEKYAKGIGLVYRERWILDTQKCSEDCQPLKDQFDACVESCLAAGTTDTLVCELQCDNLLQQFNSCFDQCDTLEWGNKAQKGFVMYQTIIDHN